MRVCVGTKDEAYYRHFIKLNVFGPIISALVDTKSKYNLLNSACLELFEFIRFENIKSIISFLYEKYGSNLREITYVDTFKNLLLKHEQNLEPVSNAKMDRPATPEASKDRWSRVDKSEEDYFASLDDADEPSALRVDSFSKDDGFPGIPRRLVDYADDDDDDLVIRKRKSVNNENEKVAAAAGKRQIFIAAGGGNKQRKIE